MATLGDVIDDRRWLGFVGRSQELAGFDDALAGRSACRVLFVHGPGGVGKTTLLLHLRSRARRAGCAALYLDGRDLDPSPDGFLHAVQSAGGATPVLLIDGYEELTAIDGWMRRDLLPALPGDGVLVLAGRMPPAAAWRSDPGWRGLVAVHQLGAFNDADSAALLERMGVAEADRARIRRLGRGHPLALALLADAARTSAVPQSLADAPDLVSALVASLVRDAPSDAHVVGLATCAKSLLTTEDLLRRTVGPSAAPEVWSWLRDRPFVTVRLHGLAPHDLTREALEAEFEQRSPDRYRELHRLVRDYFIASLRSATGMHRQLLAQHLVYLLRQGPFSAQFRAMRALGSVAVVPARHDELPGAVEQIGRQIGPRSAESARKWFAEDPGGASVLRADDGVGGFIFHVVCPAGLPSEVRDPVVRAVLEHIAATAPLRPGEQVDIARFMFGRDGSQSDQHAVFVGSVSSIVEWCCRPLAWGLVIAVDPDFWGPFFDYLGFREVLEVTFDGHRHVVYGNDFRRFPVASWLDLMSDREQAGGTGPPPESMRRPLPLSRDAFGAAVRAALPLLHRPRRLADAELGLDATAIRTAIDGLVALPRGDRLRAVLHRTYVSPAPSQEAAAEALGLPFSTYRRHLAKAVAELTETLWDTR